MIEDQKYIFPTQREQKEHFLDHILGWAKKNPTTTVNVWYDSAVTSQTSVENTKRELANQPESASIKFLDVRELPTVKANPAIFDK